MAKVLVADDSAFMRLQCGKLLQQNGLEVVQAEDGAKAVALYRSARPDAVLLDITMPNMDGLAALRAIRALDPGARVAMLTAIGQQSVMMEAIKAGATDYIVKPFDPVRVLATVRRLCSG
jgi:two-component system chemotaxis response regulator CheY